MRFVGPNALIDIVAIGFQIRFLARLEGVPLSKAYKLYVVERGRLITLPKNFIWKTILLLEISEQRVKITQRVRRTAWNIQIHRQKKIQAFSDFGAATERAAG